MKKFRVMGQGVEHSLKLAVEPPKAIAVNEIIRIKDTALGITRHYQVIATPPAGEIVLLKLTLPGIDDAREFTRGGDRVLR